MGLTIIVNNVHSGCVSNKLPSKLHLFNKVGDVRNVFESNGVIVLQCDLIVSSEELDHAKVAVKSHKVEWRIKCFKVCRSYTIVHNNMVIGNF